MACGTPVIGSNTSSLPEVADVRALARAMVLVGKHLRAELRAKGLERARQFTWEGAAQKTLMVYRRLGRTQHESE